MTNEKMARIGYALSALFAIFMLGASITPKIFGMPVAEESLVHLGWPTGYAFQIGLLELACVLLSLIPRTSIIGAIVMTAYLGGAVAMQLRVGQPLLSHTLFGVYLGLVMWGGLWFRNPSLRTLLPFRTSGRRSSTTSM